MKRKKFSPERIEKMRNSPHAGWYVAKKQYPFVIGQCETCTKDIVVKNAGFDKPTRRYCSVSCRSTASNKTRIWTKSAREKISQAMKRTHAAGKITHIHTASYREAVRKRNLGSLSHFWKGGLTSQTRLIRNSAAYKTWRKHVFARDDYTCQACKARSSKGNPVILNADHVLSFAQYPDLRFEILNGQTLCLPCHKLTPTFAVKSAHIDL